MKQDALDLKLNEIFPGKVVRKDLLLQVKKGTNVPSFVLEFLLARYCASDDPREIREGLAAVLETIQKNYVRPDESNRAQMLVQQKGKHTFIDRIHVRYYEREKRPWARMKNFNSSRIAINERYYQGENDRIFEGGIWAECTVAHNDVEDDDSLPEDADTVCWLMTQPHPRPCFTSDIRYTQKRPNPPITAKTRNQPIREMKALVLKH